jgi:hypothetical protein
MESTRMKRLRNPAPYVAALLGFALVACGVDSLPTGPSSVSTADGIPAPDSSATASTAPLYKCETPDLGSVTKVIGPAGGELDLGPHSLTIPGDALQEDVAITATIKAGQYVRIDLQPHGLQFAKAVSLTLNYEHCGTRPPKARYVAYVDDLGNVLELLDVNSHRSGRDVETRLKHFSGYAIAD